MPTAMPTAMQWRKFVLYCHVVRDDERNLLRIRKDIQQLLANNEGLLVLFIDEGLPDLLRMIHPIKRELSRSEAKKEKQKLKDDLRNRSKSLQEGERFGGNLERQLGSDVRVLTALDLVDIFGEMSTVEDLKKFLIGMKSEMRYDTPKFIESIVRLRMIGSRVPVLRLDRDVLIPPDKKRFDRGRLENSILRICEAVKVHHENTQVLATILSANYRTPTDDCKDVMVWSRGYATRIMPSLLVPDGKDAKKYIENSKQVNSWEKELRKHFLPELTRRFYSDLWKWGAPKTAVISGALLYMNDAVVLNVPPFSNFSQTVVWIDDHLRYILHREMGDFCQQTVRQYRSNRLLHVFYSEQQLTKYRTAENFLLYTVKTYLPSLLWGSFFDYWLCTNELLKRREEEVPQEKLDDWKNQRREGNPGILAKAVREARSGCLPDEGSLRDELKETANKRLEALLEIWGGLRHGDKHSLASAWVHDKLPASAKVALSDKGFTTKLPGTVEQFQDNLKDGFNELLDDTCRYVKWVFEWPRVVSVIRSIPPGEFRSDLEWSPPILSP
jgi:hypothetical protein